MSDLFRKEVLDKHSQKLHGDVLVWSPLSHKAITFLLITIMVGLVTFSVSAEYSRKERVSGILSPDLGLIQVMPRQLGLIEKTEVSVGSVVEKGDELFSVYSDTVSGYGEDTAGTLLIQLESEKDQLAIRQGLVPEEYQLSKLRLRQQIKSLESEASRLSERVALQAQTVENERVILDKFENLAKSDSASILEVSSQKNRFLSASQVMANLQNEKLKVEDQAMDLEAQYALLPITEQQNSSVLSGLILELDQKIVQMKGQERAITRAPVSGRIASMSAKEGQLTDLQRPMLTILPKESRLEARLFVPSKAAGFVKEGQEVKLLYDAFPYQKFGFHSGQVSEVSRTVINASDFAVGTNLSEPVFLVIVSLEQQNIEVNDETYVLQSGMTLSADIILEDRKIWEWIFEPLLGAMKK